MSAEAVSPVIVMLANVGVPLLPNLNLILLIIRSSRLQSSGITIGMAKDCVCPLID